MIVPEILTIVILPLFFPVAVLVRLVYFQTNPKKGNPLARSSGRLDAQQLVFVSVLVVVYTLIDG
mgnify:CR=1 FL=1